MRWPVVLLLAASVAHAEPRTLRVCADPNNLPYSNARGEGFENRIAQLLGRALSRAVRYTWWAQRRGFVRNTLNEHRCDVVIGVPKGLEQVATTRAYYRSSYAFVTRKAAKVHPRSLDDPRLSALKIGVQVIGDDGANAPPAHALARRGIVDNVVGFPVYGDYRNDRPTAAIVDAVAYGDIDVALVWGPQAGYFAKTSRVPLEVTPLAEERDGPLPLSFAIAVGVRRADAARLAELDRALERLKPEIDQVLSDFGVPVR